MLKMKKLVKKVLDIRVRTNMKRMKSVQVYYGEKKCDVRGLYEVLDDRKINVGVEILRDEKRCGLSGIVGNEKKSCQ